MKRKILGFTLVEVMVTVVILATLAALVIPRLTGQTERGVVAEAVAMLSSLRQAQASYHLENSSYTDDKTLLDVDVPADGTSAFNYSVAADGSATATRQPPGLANFGGKTIILKIDGTWDTAAQTHSLAPTN